MRHRLDFRESCPMSQSRKKDKTNDPAKGSQIENVEEQENYMMSDYE